MFYVCPPEERREQECGTSQPSPNKEGEGCRIFEIQGVPFVNGSPQIFRGARPPSKLRTWVYAESKWYECIHGLRGPVGGGGRGSEVDFHFFIVSNRGE